jgi:hypothetical protein
MNAIERHCKDTGGYIVSEATLRNQDLIPKYLDALAILAPAAYDQCQNPGCGFPMVPSHALEDWRSEWWQSESAHEAMESLTNALEEHAPEGFHFGASEGDGARFGFWRSEEEAPETLPSPDPIPLEPTYNRAGLTWPEWYAAAGYDAAQMAVVGSKRFDELRDAFEAERDPSEYRKEGT